MAKNQRQLKAAKSGNQTLVEQSEVSDDHLLPDAVEIEKLHQLDSGILPWLKERAAKEQDFRHNAYDKRLKYFEDESAREHNTVRLGLIIYFMLVAGLGAASFVLISSGKSLEGSIFGGAAALLALAVLVTRGTRQQNK